MGPWNATKLTKGAHETTQTPYVKVQDLITPVPGKEGLTVDLGGTLLKNNLEYPQWVGYFLFACQIENITTQVYVLSKNVRYPSGLECQVHGWRQFCL